MKSIIWFRLEIDLVFLLEYFRLEYLSRVDGLGWVITILELRALLKGDLFYFGIWALNLSSSFLF